MSFLYDLLYIMLMASKAYELPLLNWGAMRLHLYWAYEGTPAYTQSSQTVASQTAWLLRRGTVRLRWRERELMLMPGQWIIMGAGRGEHEFSDDAQLLSICFRAEWFTGQAFFEDSSPVVLDARECPRLGQTADQLVQLTGRIAPESKHQLFFQPFSFPMFLRLRRAYLSWLEALAGRLHKTGVGIQHARPSDDRVLDAIRLLDDWPMQRAFDERKVAEDVGISRAHFNRLFTSELGLSAKAYFERRRLQAARERLIADDTPIKTIAYQLGFHDAPHFSHWFRKHTSASPSHFRKGLVSTWEVT